MLHLLKLYFKGEIQQKTDWHRISVFKPHLRDVIMEHLKKGYIFFVLFFLN